MFAGAQKHLGQEATKRFQKDATSKIRQEATKAAKNYIPDLFKDSTDALQKQEIFDGLIKYIPYTRNPRIKGVSNNLECKVDAKMLRIFDTHDAMDLTLKTQLQAIFVAFDVHSDVFFLIALFNQDKYREVTQWKKDIALMLFCLAQFLWLCAGLVLALMLGSKLIRWTSPWKRVYSFCMLWLAMLLNAPLISLLQLVSYGTTHFQVDSHYGAAFVAAREIRESKTEGAVGLIPQSITLIVEDIGLLIMNLLITAEVGFTYESTLALLIGVICVGMKAQEIYSFWRLGLTDEKKLLDKHKWQEEGEDAALAQSVGQPQYEPNTGTVHDAYNESCHGGQEEISPSDHWAVHGHEGYTHAYSPTKPPPVDDGDQPSPAIFGDDLQRKAPSEEAELPTPQSSETAYQKRKKKRDQGGGPGNASAKPPSSPRPSPSAHGSATARNRLHKQAEPPRTKKGAASSSSSSSSSGDGDTGATAATTTSRSHGGGRGGKGARGGRVMF